MHIRDKAGRVNLFLKPVNKRKLKLIAYSNGKTASEMLDELVENYTLDLSRFQDKKK